VQRLRAIRHDTGRDGEAANCGASVVGMSFALVTKRKAALRRDAAFLWTSADEQRSI
jgi:hypothetical protein